MALDRRTFLGSMTAAGVSLAGCTSSPDPSGDSEPGETSPGSADDGDGSAAKNSGDSLKNHPSAAALGSQPHLGPAPSDADGVIVEFADPSCPGCARFERNTYPEIKSKLVDPGKVAFVYREYPNVAPWGEPASQALEGTLPRSEDAFWQLKSQYYAKTDEFTEDNVLEKTGTYLKQNTDVRAEAVVDGVKNDEFAGAVQQDVETANEAGVSGTPAFFLFRSGSFVTTIEGPQEYGVFKNALGF